ncbi:DUF2339 domain-containing protein [Dyella sp.]|nr:DUF2339 domain-containing protein [Dyella sp.]MDR3445453.1 DUF2339 domain-containing protein [Dyella sp.]
MIFLWMVIGAVLGGLVSSASLAGIAGGAAVGLLWGRQMELSRELGRIRQQLTAAKPAQPVPAAQSEQAPAERPWMTAQEAREALHEPVPPVAPPVAAVSRPPVQDVEVPPPVPSLEPAPRPIAPPTPAMPRQPSGFDRLMQRVWGWFTEGNVPVKIGMLVLFAGVAALLKYASDAGMLHVPVALRVSMVALAATGGLFFGWHKRESRRVFALSLQGGSIGVLVMTVFAAFRLYDLLPASAAFGVLVVLVAGIGVLAVMQDALALAVLGLIAGFAAPILVSTGNGSHVALFSYYAVLNLAILGIAWKRSWRVLNLLGFIATFAVGSAWGVLRYDHSLFASTEPFLILNFLFYLFIPWLHVVRAPVDRRLVIDGCLMFGNPLISLLLQGALLKWDGQALAISTLVAASVYVGVAYLSRHQPGMRLIRDTWAILAVALATLTVPLALSADVTGSIFALEGAGLIWLGLRQQRWLATWSGIALQVFAACALLVDRGMHGGVHVAWPVLNRECISALMLVIAGFASAGLFARLGNGRVLHRVLSVVLYAWGMLWWVVACAEEISNFVPDANMFAAWFAWLAVTAWGAAEASMYRSSQELGFALRWTPVAFMACMLVLVALVVGNHQQPWHGWNLLAVIAAAVLGWRTLLCVRSADWAGPAAQWMWLWRWFLLAGFGVAVALDRLRWLSGSWVAALSLTSLLLAFVAAHWRPRLIAPPMTQSLSRWLPPLKYSLLIALGLAGVFALFMDGDAAPLCYVPLLNPVELLLLAIAAMFAAWITDPSLPAVLRHARGPVLGSIVLALVTSFTLRAVHQLGGVAWNADLADSSLAQMSLTVVWSVLGLFAWVWGSRRGHRLFWLAGAIIMGVVLAKLILVDRRQLGNLFGIGSFIAFGLLCSVIGYLAPAPPRRSSSMEETGHAP